MSVVLDAGALIAYERRDQVVQALLEHAKRMEIAIVTTTGVVAQVWRNPATQVDLARLLRGVDEAELTQDRARSAGILLRKSDTADIVDASVVNVADDGDEILTSDPVDITRLAASAGKTLIITHVG